MRSPRTAALVAGGFVAVLAALVPPPLAAQEEPPADPAALGQRLYTTGCSSCHGVDAGGTDRGPSLQGVGAASVDFWVSSGRMPLKSPRNQAVRKPPAYDQDETDAIVAYVTSIAPGGPPVPELHLDEADLVEGGELFRANCAACHGAAGIGGALASGRHAPALKPASPRQIAEAVRTGPNAMPNFGPDTFTDEQVASIAAYVESLDHPDDDGGFGLGHAGPIPEGFVGWLVGLGALLLACYWIGERE